MTDRQKTLSGQAVIFEIQRLSTEDGPGIRTTAFFKGCPLRCVWCHNPESISPHPQIHWFETRCIGCKHCIDVCPENALAFTGQGIVIDRKACKNCGQCADECPSTAMELVGKRWSVDDLVVEVMKDHAYFEKSGGGITVSGGEPTMQAGVVSLFLRKLREKGIHTALDTCGLCRTEALDSILPHAALVMFDIKLIDAKMHRTFTGSDNHTIIANLSHVADYIRTHLYPTALWIRTPVIPDATGLATNIEEIGKLIASLGRGAVTKWELCAFNNLCGDKYRRLGQHWNYAGYRLLTRDFMEEMATAAKKSGVDPAIVQWSGSTRIDEGPADKNKKRADFRVIDGQSKP